MAPDSDSRAFRALSGGFLALCAATTGLVVLGALVRAHGAGLACPDWPLCFGQAIPRFDLRIAFEWSHRVVAGGVGLTFAALALATWRRPAARARCDRALALAAALLALQILLGALTVWHLLASWTVTSHLITGNAFNAALLWIGLRLRDAPERRAQPLRGALGAWLPVTLLTLLLQLALGGLVSSQYAGLACPEWPTCNGGQWFPSLSGAVGLHVLHRMNGYLLLALLLGGALLARGAGRLGGTLALAAALGLAQVVVGVLNVRLGLPVEVTGLHSALAAALVLSLAAASAFSYGAASEGRG